MTLIFYRADLNQSRQEKRMPGLKPDQVPPPLLDLGLELEIGSELGDLPSTSGIIPGNLN